MLGMILLAGSTVNNSILFLDFYLRRRLEEGMPTRTAILATAEQRLRPILMTSLTTVLGMIPLALGLGSGGEVLQALGISVAAGLAISTPLCLYLIPAILWLLDRDDAKVSA